MRQYTIFMAQEPDVRSGACGGKFQRYFVARYVFCNGSRWYIPETLQGPLHRGDQGHRAMLIALVVFIHRLHRCVL
jgi:hypothetical protein